MFFGCQSVLLLSSQEKPASPEQWKSTLTYEVKACWDALRSSSKSTWKSRWKGAQHGSPERGASLGKKPGTAEIMLRPIVTKLATKFHIFCHPPGP